jgi:hypothetical protein
MIRIKDELGVKVAVLVIFNSNAKLLNLIIF